MIKIILSITIVALIFSGCVGTLIATNNDKES
jgi:PBP1b-binding outer membrane lipoprotein LpoB